MADEDFEHLVIYAGPSLRGEAPPVHLFLDPHICQMFYEKSPLAWAAVIHYIETAYDDD